MNRPRLTAPDIAIGVALLLLVAAATRPMLESRRYQALVDRAVTEVDLLRAEALDLRNTSGSWPDDALAGDVPNAPLPADSGRTGASFDDFTMEWMPLDVIEYVEAPPAYFASMADDDEPDTSVPPSNVIGDLPPDSATSPMAPAVRRIGAIVIRTGNESLLADLLTRYGSMVSYVRDNTWTLIVDDRSGPTP